MISRDFRNLNLPMLGMGCMRLPLLDEDDDARPDQEKVNRIVEEAMEAGIRYFDLAYGYHEGNCERVMKEALKGFPRDSYYLADKFPGYDSELSERPEEVFEEQLRRAGTEYFDFYLLHNVCEMDFDRYKDPEGKIMSCLLKEKKNGRIRHLGFSTHARIETFREFMEIYKDTGIFEFCQIQLNWIDYHFQEAKLKLELLNELKLPVWVMEPCRGGKLIWLDDPDLAKLSEMRPGASAAEWAFDFVKSCPGVTLVLSGMTEGKELAENVRIFERESEMTDAEKSLLYDIAEKMTKGVPCTRCRYCTSYCPQEIDIPLMISLYNENTFTRGGWRAPRALDAISREKHPDACLSCGACSAVCPQHIDIPGVMKDFSRQLLIPPSEPRPAVDYRREHPEKFREE